MAKQRDFTDILVKKGILSADQLEEAKGVAAQTGAKINDALVKLGYAKLEEVMAAVAEHSGTQFVDLTDVTIPPAVVEMVPESVARSPQDFHAVLVAQGVTVLTQTPSAVAMLPGPIDARMNASRKKMIGIIPLLPRQVCTAATCALSRLRARAEFCFIGLGSASFRWRPEVTRQFTQAHPGPVAGHPDDRFGQSVQE